MAHHTPSCRVGKAAPELPLLARRSFRFAHAVNGGLPLAEEEPDRVGKGSADAVHQPTHRGRLCPPYPRPPSR